MSKNVFADLELPNPETRQAKAELSLRIREKIKALGLSEAQAAHQTSFSQNELAQVLRGQNKDFTVERMQEALANLERVLAELREAKYKDIDFSDIPATRAEDWKDAVRGKFYRPEKADGV